ncbi:hypothetical protein TP41_12345 [Xanthomonas euvesicatoria pv. citrumelonis]|nr:hypothetical protein TP41_12345 [Xanthomonas euvesicatoria pv. citrumelonis]
MSRCAGFSTRAVAPIRPPRPEHACRAMSQRVWTVGGQSPFGSKTTRSTGGCMNMVHEHAGSASMRIHSEPGSMCRLR